MHIPDGYLSPSTCASFYAASAPFWYVALRRVKRALSSRTIPLLAVFSAFSFVVMMFNVPLPGGTTGHAVGITIASIIVGPSVAIVAVSLALLVQALLFGDGGITTYGANCFNMAIVGALVGAAAYRLVSLRAPILSRRRVFAAGLGGYLAINAAALCAAIEFGLQPVFFHDAAGVPIYAPYPLSVALPAMMIGHLTVAGFAELLLTAGMVAYLQKADPGLLTFSKPASALPPAPSGLQSLLFPAATRKLWAILGILLILVPIGILAGGSAWGEWRARDFAGAQTRANIVRQSGGQPLPAAAPAGLSHLRSLWQAPVADYAPAMVPNQSFGYLLSATAGVIAIITGVFLATFFARKLTAGQRSRRPVSFVEKTIARMLRLADEALFAEQIASQDGFLQRVDSRVKIVSLLALVLATVAAHQLISFVLVGCLICLLALFSRIPLRTFALRVGIPVISLTGVLALPALFLRSGHKLVGISWLTIYSGGLQSATHLVLRATCAAALVFLLLTTTRWNELLRALRWLKVPALIVATLQICYRYLFLLLQTAHNMFESRQVRTIGRLSAVPQGLMLSATAAVLLDKSFQLSNDVHDAMLARGFRGEIVLLDENKISANSWIILAALLGFSVCLACWGR